MSDKTREAFEVWAKKAGWPHYCVNADGSYFCSSSSWEPWQAATQHSAARIAELEEHLKFVERWANHHGAKPHTTQKEALSVIQHYPPIKAITRSYKDGVVPDTFDPYARIEALEAEVQALRRDAERWRTFLAARPANTHAVIIEAIDDAAIRKGGGV